VHHCLQHSETAADLLPDQSQKPPAAVADDEAAAHLPLQQHQHQPSRHCCVDAAATAGLAAGQGEAMTAVQCCHHAADSETIAVGPAQRQAAALDAAAAAAEDDGSATAVAAASHSLVPVLESGHLSALAANHDPAGVVAATAHQPQLYAAVVGQQLGQLWVLACLEAR